jgi:queuosine precursor transporter
LARPAGFEPATPSLEGSYSIQLNYGRALGPNNHFAPCCKAGYAAMMHEQEITAQSAASVSSRNFRYYDFVMAAFVAILLLSNVIGAAKPAALTINGEEWVFGAGILFFPLGYVIGDVLTEVYGFARARRVIWAGFAGLVFMAFMSWIVVSLPPAAGWEGQAAYESVFGQVWRIVIASITAFWVGEFVNSYVMARMKVWTQGRHLWSRTIGSTFVGQGVDSLIFYPLAFWGVWQNEVVITVMITNWLFKVLWEVVLTPVTYAVVGWLKHHEGVDIFDDGTDFSPFKTTV